MFEFVLGCVLILSLIIRFILLDEIIQIEQYNTDDIVTSYLYDTY